MAIDVPLGQSDSAHNTMMESGLNGAQRRALALLASAGHNGATQSLLTAHGFPTAVVVGLVNRGLAMITGEKIRAGGKMVDVEKVRITQARREVLAVVD